MPIITVWVSKLLSPDRKRERKRGGGMKGWETKGRGLGESACIFFFSSHRSSISYGVDQDEVPELFYESINKQVACGWEPIWSINEKLAKYLRSKLRLRQPAFTFSPS